MTVKIIFERSSQKGGVGRGFEKRVNRGPTLKFYCRPKAQEKQHFGKLHFHCRRFSPGNIVTIVLDNYPIRELLSERILVISAPPNVFKGAVNLLGHICFLKLVDMPFFSVSKRMSEKGFWTRITFLVFLLFWGVLWCFCKVLGGEVAWGATSHHLTLPSFWYVLFFCYFWRACFCSCFSAKILHFSGVWLL